MPAICDSIVHNQHQYCGPGRTQPVGNVLPSCSMKTGDLSSVEASPPSRVLMSDDGIGTRVVYHIGGRAVQAAYATQGSNRPLSSQEVDGLDPCWWSLLRIHEAAILHHKVVVHEAVELSLNEISIEIWSGPCQVHLSEDALWQPIPVSEGVGITDSSVVGSEVWWTCELIGLGNRWIYPLYYLGSCIYLGLSIIIEVKLIIIYSLDITLPAPSALKGLRLGAIGGVELSRCGVGQRVFQIFGVWSRAHLLKRRRLRGPCWWASVHKIWVGSNDTDWQWTCWRSLFWVYIRGPRCYSSLFRGWLSILGCWRSLFRGCCGIFCS